MNSIFQEARYAAALLLLALGACGGGGGADNGTSPPAGTVIGAAGGTVTGPNGVTVVIPAGALATDATIAIEQLSAGSPALPPGTAVSGPTFSFTPHGITFAVPVTITLPFNPSSVPVGQTPALYKTNATNQWEHLALAIFGVNSVSAAVSGFSFGQVVIPPLQRNEPVRVWEFGAFPGTGAAEVDFGGATQVGGTLDQTVDFGIGLADIDVITLTQTLPADTKARGYIFGTANGATYGVYAEAPFSQLGRADPIGAIARLTQTQSFIKRSADATLSFTLSSVLIQGFDADAFPGLETSIKGEVYFEVQAYTNRNRSFFHTIGGATITRSGDTWEPDVWNYRGSRTPLWSDANFEFTTSVAIDPRFAPCAAGVAILNFRRPRTYSVNLSTIAVDEEFTLRATASASAHNQRGGGSPGDCEASAVLAYLRDPQGVGGTSLAFVGLEPSNNPLLVPPAEVPEAPAACVPGPGPDPAAGVLQFSAASFSIGEFPAATPTVRVTRTGGSRGAVTATVRTSDGTATAGTDYSAVNATVFFADGDAAPRVVEVPILPDALIEPDETVNLTLSQPGGCAALGAQATAVLTIRNDDQPPPPGTGGSLDPSFGSGGKVAINVPPNGFGGVGSAMALQADGKIVMVGGRTSEFVLARFNADGSLDAGFGTGGKVTTDVIVGLAEESARAVAVQADGRIVVVGFTGVNGRPGRPVENRFDFALARYDANGSLDTSFGSGGLVTSGVIGRAFAVAIQPDGKIVVAGVAPATQDFALARYNADGRLDASFGIGGQLTTDIAGGFNLAGNIVLQSNGAIVVSGKPIGTSAALDHTDLVRYDRSGNLDTSFGAGGKVTLNGALVGEGLALQRDGKLVLVGSAGVGTTSVFEVMRLNADGSPDTSFGSAGTASTSITTQGATANAVALQGDGKIVVAGQAAGSDFAVARFNSDGTLDTTFANFGKLTINFGFSDSAESVVVQPDGKIVLGGRARNLVDGYGLARINP